MKNLSIVLAVFSIGTAPLLPESIVQSVPTTEVSQPLGKTAISSIRSAYERGDYDQFLKEMDDSYKAALESNQLEMLRAMRPGLSSELQKWEMRAHILQQEKSSELLQIIENQTKSHFVEKVASAAANFSDEEQQNAIDRMALFRQCLPGTGKNNDKNVLIDLDLEYEYKAIHLDLPGFDRAERRERQCALKMEKLERIEQLSKQFQDTSLKKAVTVYAGQFDARLAQSWDIADLNALANGKTKPANALEEKVASLFSLYQEKIADLTRQMIAEDEQNG